MNKLTKEEIQKLTAEQQETLAGMELQRLRKRQQLLKLAGRYRGFYLVPLLLAGFAFVLIALRLEKTLVIACCIGAAFGCIQFHVNGLNRRLDALAELFASEQGMDDGKG